MTDLHKVQQEAAHLRGIIRNDDYAFARGLPDGVAPTVDISGDQDWAKELGAKDDSTKLSATLEGENVGKRTEIPHRADQKLPSLLKNDSPQQSSDLPKHPPFKEGRLRGNTRVPARYQGFALFSAGYIQRYKEKERGVLKDCWNFRVKRDGKGEIVRYKTCKVVESYHHKFGDKHHLGMGVNQPKGIGVDAGTRRRGCVGS